MKLNRNPTFTRRKGAIFAAIALLIGSITATSAFGQGQRRGGSECDSKCQKELALAAAATARYQREEVAVTDGFLATDHCVSVPGLGGMGLHYLNPSRAMDLNVNAEEPELLLYEPTADGKKKLVAVEYFVPVISNGEPWFDPNTPPPVIDNAPPVLFGQTFNGPMPGHEPGMPWHYDLHVWIWKHNPSGVFTPFNPSVRCPQ